jgi:Putative adhesin
MNGDTVMTTALMAPGRLRMTPARILTLVIGVPLILSLIGWTGFTVIAEVGQASFPVSYTVPVDHGQLVANVASGDVTVRPVAGTTAHLAGHVQYSLVRPGITERTTASGTTLSLSCHLQTGNCGLDATLSVPYDTAVTLSSEGGDLTASTLTGRLTFDTAGGNINGDTLTAPYLHAESGGGDVSLVFTKPPGNLDITSDGGNVNVVLPHSATAYRVATSPDGGNATDAVPTSDSASNTITIQSGGGDISITEAS